MNQETEMTTEYMFPGTLMMNGEQCQLLVLRDFSDGLELEIFSNLRGAIALVQWQYGCCFIDGSLTALGYRLQVCLLSLWASQLSVVL